MKKTRWICPLVACGAFLGSISFVAASPLVLVPANAVWKYLADGTDRGTAWTAPTFNDSTWSSGAAQLGYGDGDEATVIGFGPNPMNRYITTYFRLNLVVPAGITDATFVRATAPGRLTQSTSGA